MKQAPITGEAVRGAIRMYRMGHRDLVDDPLFSIAASGGLRLLTLDEELVRFMEDHGLPREHVMTPDEL